MLFFAAERSLFTTHIRNNKQKNKNIKDNSCISNTFRIERSNVQLCSELANCLSLCIHKTEYHENLDSKKNR